LSFFLLKDGRALLSASLNAFGEGTRRDMFKDIANDVHLLLIQYMRSLVLLGLAAAITYATFFSIIRLPYGLLLGAIAFFFEFVPMVGPLTSAVIVLLVAGLTGFDHLLWIALFLAAFLFYQPYPQNDQSCPYNPGHSQPFLQNQPAQQHRDQWIGGGNRHHQ